MHMHVSIIEDIELPNEKLISLTGSLKTKYPPHFLKKKKSVFINVC